MLPRVFDLFVQGQRGADRAEGGLGIGLALVKNLVGMHGGNVSAYSDGPGLGAEFIVRLPLNVDEVPAIGKGATPSARDRADGRQVLVVDDNVDAAEMLGMVLREQGHRVLVVHDPVAALKAARSFRPEVAVLDIGLPVMDGYELAARLRVELGAHACRLIALTGYGQETDRVRSLGAGFEAHLVKPVDFAQLAALVGARAAPQVGA
jgi:CheY-like chemotaxis protein